MHKNTTAIRTDILTIASTHHDNRTALRISNDIGFSVVLSCARFFRVIAVTLQEPFGITFCIPRVQNKHVTCEIIIQDTSEVYFYILK